jgi:hypothetical protein
MQDCEIATMGGPIMVVRYTGKVGRAFGIFYAHETILRLRFNGGYEASFRLTDLQAASAEQIERFQREEIQNTKAPFAASAHIVRLTILSHNISLLKPGAMAFCIVAQLEAGSRAAQPHSDNGALVLIPSLPVCDLLNMKGPSVILSVALLVLASQLATLTQRA